MLISASHLSVVTERNIHIVRWPNNADHVESAAREAATALDYHWALLDGRVLTTEEDLLAALPRAFEFPHVPDNGILNWDATADCIGDLGWLVRRQTGGAGGTSKVGKRGVVVALREPVTLMQSNLLQFAILIDTLGTQSQYLLKRWAPFHVVVGPMPQEYRYEFFMNTLSVSKYFCEACQMVDGASISEEEVEP
jgi:hypothetical protein